MKLYQDQYGPIFSPEPILNFLHGAWARDQTNQYLQLLNLFLHSALSLHDWTHTVLQTRLHYHLGAALILTAPCTALEGTHLQKIKWHCSSFALTHEYTYCFSCGKLFTHHYWE